MLEGSCHCGAVRLTLPFAPAVATSCNCSLCRRLGGTWAYYEFGTVAIQGHPENTSEYVWGDKTLRTVHCKACACVTHWEPLQPVAGSKHGVNLANFDPALLASARVRRFDGADTWQFLDDSSHLFDHVKFGVSDYAASKAFFLAALQPLGIAVVSEGPPAYGVELCGKGDTSLCLYQSTEKPAHLHLAFAAESRQQVDAFYRAALQAGGQDNGAPGLRPHYHANYYAAFVIGPDGHNIEAVCQHAEA